VQAPAALAALHSGGRDSAGEEAHGIEPLAGFRARVAAAVEAVAAAHPGTGYARVREGLSRGAQRQSWGAAAPAWEGCLCRPGGSLKQVPRDTRPFRVIHSSQSTQHASPGLPPLRGSRPRRCSWWRSARGSPPRDGALLSRRSRQCSRAQVHGTGLDMGPAGGGQARQPRPRRRVRWRRQRGMSLTGDRAQDTMLRARVLGVDVSSGKGNVARVPRVRERLGSHRSNPTSQRQYAQCSANSLGSPPVGALPARTRLTRWRTPTGCRAPTEKKQCVSRAVRSLRTGGLTPSASATAPAAPAPQQASGLGDPIRQAT
jgi:hypothetical protein